MYEEIAFVWEMGEPVDLVAEGIVKLCGHGMDGWLRVTCFACSRVCTCPKISSVKILCRLNKSPWDETSINLKIKVIKTWNALKLVKVWESSKYWSWTLYGRRKRNKIKIKQPKQTKKQNLFTLTVERCIKMKTKQKGFC